MSSDEKPPYRVGYGRPPVHSRFKKGQSGNPRGRPRKSHLPCDVVARIRDERHKIVINGKERYVSAAEAALRKALHQSMTSGSVSDLLRLFRFFQEHGSAPLEDREAEAMAQGQKVVEKLFEYFDRTVPDDPLDEPPAQPSS